MIFWQNIIFNEKKELKENGKPRPRILKPRDGEKLSLFEITELSHNEICAHGHTFVDNPSKKRIHIGYVKFIYRAFNFKKLGLVAIYDDKPPGHVSVEFPGNPEYRREVAKALADEVIVIDTTKTKKHFSPCQ